MKETMAMITIVLVPMMLMPIMRSPRVGPLITRTIHSRTVRPKKMIDPIKNLSNTITFNLEK